MKKFTLSVIAAMASVMSLWAYDAENLYVVGSGCSAGWNPDGALEMTKIENNVFTWQGELSSKGEFKFIVAHDWHPSITCDFNTENQGNETVVGGETYNLFVRPDDSTGKDNKFQVAVSGIYTLNVDLNNMKMAAVLDEMIEEPVEIYLVGNASKGGWDLQNALKQKFTLLDNGHYSWSGELTLEDADNADSGRFRFITAAEWWPSYTTANEEADENVGIGTYDLRYCETAPEPQSAFRINASGLYFIDLDLENMQMTISEKEETLFVIGNALNGISRNQAWDLSWASPCTPTGKPHEFSWNNFLFSEDEEGLPTQFRFLSSDTDWDGFVSATAENEEIEIGGTYELAPISNADWKFTVPAEGFYHFIVNTADLTFTVSDGAGVESVKTDNSCVKINGLTITVEGAEADVFDTMGRAIAAKAANITLPAAGIYFVAVDGKVLKIAAK